MGILPVGDAADPGSGRRRARGPGAGRPSRCRGGRSRGIRCIGKRAIGAWSLSATLFFFGEIFLIALCLNYAVRLSRITLDAKTLTQEIALLRAEVERRQE